MAASRSSGSSSGMPSPVSPLVSSYSEWAFGRPTTVLPRPPGTFQTGAFGPEPPLVPMPVDEPDDTGTLEPRRTQYPVAWNLPVGVPGSEGLGKLASFTTLRAMADKYSVTRACVRNRVQEILGLDWDITPTDDAKVAMKDNVSLRADWEKRKAEVMRFWERPDRSPESPYEDWEQWMTAMIEDQLVTDAVAIYLHPPLGGKGAGIMGSNIGSLDLIDGTTIRPLYSMHGGLPGPSAAAYQQFLWGVPRSDFATLAEGRDADELPDYVDQFARQELIYQRLWPRTWTPYGFSCVEQALMPTAIGYARQTSQMEFFTEGSVPYMYVVPGEQLIQSPQQVRQLQNALNAIAGDTGWKQRIIVLPPGSKADPIKPNNLADQFDEVITSLVTMAFGLTPMDLGMAPKVAAVQSPAASNQMSKVASQSSNDRWLKPVCNTLARRFTRIIKHVLNQPDMEWTWTGLESGEDADDIINQALNKLKSSAITIDEAREAWGDDPFGAPWSTVPLAFAATGVTPIGTAVEMANQALEAAKNPPKPIVVSSTPKPPQDGSSGDEGGAPAKPAPKPGGSGPSAEEANDSPLQDAGEEVHDQNAAPGAPKASTKAQLAELDLLGRLLRKGKPLDEFVPNALDTATLDVIRAELPDVDDAVIAATVHIAKHAQVEKKKPIAAGLVVKADDTGRVLMVQRSVENHNEAAAGLWEWPGGKLDKGDSPLDAAKREWQEEVGIDLPDGKLVGQWVANGGKYVGFVYVIPHEADLELNDARGLDGTGDSEVENVAWWDPTILNGNPAVRTEVQSSDWALIGHAKKMSGHTDMPKPLLDYWSHGKGAAEIDWGRDGDFDRCREHLGKYVDPAQLDGLCAALHQRVTHAAPGHAPGETHGKAAEPDPKGEGPADWPGRPLHDQIEQAYVPPIEQALVESIAGQIEEMLERIYGQVALLPTVSKVTPGGYDPKTVAGIIEQAIRDLLSATPDKLVSVLQDLITDAWGAGQHAANVLLPGGLKLDLPAIDWSNWKPGDPTLANALERTGGIGRLLAAAGHTINGVDSTTLARISSKIAQGIRAGADMRTVAAQVQQVVDNRARAQMIARTETARAMAQASLDTYRRAGVEMVDWLTGDNACPQCVHNEQMGPYTPEQFPYLPAHPNCRCAPSVHLEDA